MNDVGVKRYAYTDHNGCVVFEIEERALFKVKYYTADNPIDCNPTSPKKEIGAHALDAEEAYAKTRRFIEHMDEGISCDTGVGNPRPIIFRE